MFKTLSCCIINRFALLVLSPPCIMIPFALKVTWFILSISGMFPSYPTEHVASNMHPLSGTLISTPVLIAFSKAINAKWIPITYFLANLVLQGSVCLGASVPCNSSPNSDRWMNLIRDDLEDGPISDATGFLYSSNSLDCPRHIHVSRNMHILCHSNLFGR